MIVVDAGVLVAALAFDDDDGSIARERLLQDPDAHAPHVIDVEVGGALWRLAARQGAIDLSRARAGIAALTTAPLTRYSHLPLLARAWELRPNVGSHDAMYVALAEALAAPLVTVDRRLARAPGPRCRIEVLPGAGPEHT